MDFSVLGEVDEPKRWTWEEFRQLPSKEIITECPLRHHVVSLMAMIRQRAAAGSDVPARLPYSSCLYEDIIYREELEKVTVRGGSLEVIHALTRSRPEG